MAMLRIQTHLNLAKPELAENAVRVQSENGAWVTVAYATELMIEDVAPLVMLGPQGRIRQGDSRKVPHAFLEGNLRHFKGRLREKAPDHLKALALPFLIEHPKFVQCAQQACEADEQINYNPRFASCFYRDRPEKSAIQDKLVGCGSLVAIGWKFWGMGTRWVPMRPKDRCKPEALELASPSEWLTLRRGRATTAALLQATPKP